MITLLTFQFWLFFLLFIFSVFVSFFIPGDLLVRRLNMKFSHRFVLSTILGVVFWTVQGFVFCYLNLRWLSYFYIISAILLWLILNKVMIRKIFRLNFTFIKPDYLLLLIVAFGMLIQLTPVLGFGLRYREGIFLCCGNRQDYLFHVALSQSIVRKFPPDEPGMSGVEVKNYHYWSNMAVAELSRVYKLPIFSTQFQYITIFLSLFLGLTVITFAQILNISKSFTRWLTFLLYFGGDGIYLLLLFVNKSFSGVSSLSSLEDGSLFLINPPRAFSIIIAFAGLALISFWLNRKSKTAGILGTVLLASTLGFKIYTGLFLAIGILFLEFYFILRKQWKYFLILMSFFPVALIIYFSNNVASGGLFWAPFHLAKNFIVQPSLNLVSLELARQVFLAHNNYLRALQYEITFSAIFIFAILGTKVVAFLQPPKYLLKIKLPMLILLVTGTLGSLFVGMFFLQKSGGSNTFNFVVSFVLFISIFSALSLDYWRERLKSLKYLFILLIILFTVPRVILNTFASSYEYFKFEYLMVSNQEIEAYDFLKNKTSKNAIILVDPDYRFEVNAPHVAAFVDRSMFFSGEQILKSHGVEVSKREQIRETIYTSGNYRNVGKELFMNKIDYVFFKRETYFKATESAIFSDIVFRNASATIVRIDKNKLNTFMR